MCCWRTPTGGSPLSAGGSREARIDAARDAFYRGFVAEAVDAFFAEEDGLLTRPTTWRAGRRRSRTPVTLDYHGHTICKTGPWGQGPVMLQQLALLAGLRPRGDGPGAGLRPHRDRVREARVRRSRGLVRRPRFHRRAAGGAAERRRTPTSAARWWASARRKSFVRAPRADVSRSCRRCPGGRRRWLQAPASRRSGWPATPATSTSPTATATSSPRRRAAAGSTAPRTSPASASAWARAGRCSGSPRGCRTRSSRASARARR